MLQPLLQEYLMENGNLPLPNAGRLMIQHTPAYLNDSDKTFNAPNSKIVFSDVAPAERELQTLIAFIARKLSISSKESKGLLEKEVGLKVEPGESRSINWPEWDLFQNKKDDFNPQQPTLNDYLPAFPVEKIFRQPVTQTEPEAVTFPEPEAVTLPAETASVETISTEAYPEYEEPVAKDYWWVWALVIFVVSVMMIVYRYA